MNPFNDRDGELYVENLSLNAVAKTYGTPTYVYSRAALSRNYQAYANALGNHPGMVCYAVKANSNIAVLNVLARLGVSWS